MPVPSSGALKLRGNGDGTGIAEEVDGSVTGTNVSLAQVSITAEFSAPHGMGEFYGYTSNAPASSVYLRDNYGQTTNPNQSPCGGHTITWTCNVNDDDKTGANYKFYRNGSLVQNGTSTTYATSGTSTTYAIYCKYTDAGGISVDSSTWNQSWGGSQISTYRRNYGFQNNYWSSLHHGGPFGSFGSGGATFGAYNYGPATIPSGQIHASISFSGISPYPNIQYPAQRYLTAISPGQTRPGDAGVGVYPSTTYVAHGAREHQSIGGGGCSYVATASTGQTTIGAWDG